MKKFFGDDVLLHSQTAEMLYGKIKALPVIDYHCHLDARMIAENARFSDVGEMWLAHDHYKWRAMRLNGIDEKYITGDAEYRDKFFKYAEIMPALIGNPLYYWTHLELKQIFGINKPLNAVTAKEIYEEANGKLKDISVRSLLDFFRVEFVATTDDPTDELLWHGKYGKTLVAPTFRPDKVYFPEEGYLDSLGKAAGMKIGSLEALQRALERRLDYFAGKGCRISDHGFDKFPAAYADKAEAERIFEKGMSATTEEKQAFFGYILVWLAGEYAKRNIAMQIHFGVTRNVNERGFQASGADSGYDVISSPVDSLSLLAFLRRLPPEGSPQIVLYALNDALLPSLACVTGAFRNVRMGAAWWFNDTLEGIKRNLTTIAEYASLGGNLGMLTDSRSFSSYSRFDFFRRILCDFVGGYVEKGEYDEAAAETLLKNICYKNAKEFMKL